MLKNINPSFEPRSKFFSAFRVIMKFRYDVCNNIHWICIKILSECSPMVRGTWVQSPCRVIPKTLKMVLDTSLLNTQQYKIRIKGVVAIEKGAFWSPSTTVANFTYFTFSFGTDESLSSITVVTFETVLIDLKSF